MDIFSLCRIKRYASILVVFDTAWLIELNESSIILPVALLLCNLFLQADATFQAPIQKIKIHLRYYFFYFAES